MESAQWTDNYVALELWAHLTHLSYDVRDHAHVTKCAIKAIEVDKLLTSNSNKRTADRCE